MSVTWLRLSVPLRHPALRPILRPFAERGGVMTFTRICGACSRPRHLSSGAPHRAAPPGLSARLVSPCSRPQPAVTACPPARPGPSAWPSPPDLPARCPGETTLVSSDRGSRSSLRASPESSPGPWLCAHRSPQPCRAAASEREPPPGPPRPPPPVSARRPSAKVSLSTCCCLGCGPGRLSYHHSPHPPPFNPCGGIGDPISRMVTSGGGESWLPGLPQP